MFSPLNTSIAKKYCLETQESFDKNGVDATVGFSQEAGSNNAEERGNVKYTSVYAKKPERPSGQMFGVLVCTDSEGKEVVLKAFSGQFNSVWNIPGWAPPMLSESEFARLTEKTDKEIHELSSQIEALENEIKTQCAASVLGESDEKLRLLKETRRTASKKSMEEIFTLYSVPVLSALETAETYTWTNPKNGKSYPRYKLRPVFARKSIFEFYGSGAQGSSDNGKNCKHDKMPPTGAGECCAPKLIAQAYNMELRPLSLAEFYYGESSLSGEKQHKQFYEPCDEKCGPLLPVMLGIKILYQDEAIVVVEKPSGLLSVPGRGAEKQDCVVNRVKFLFGGDIGWCDQPKKEPSVSGADSTGDNTNRDTAIRCIHCIEQPSVHRLDMETSGILVLALTDEAHRNLSRQFEEGTVKKQYEAVLDGIPECIRQGTTSGRLELPFRLDVENRPRQIYDETNGKIGITEWEFLRYEKGGRVRLLFTPRTGRTHQLRLHSADAHGLGVPIVGDTLYGTSAEKNGAKSTTSPSANFGSERLMLHARMLEFTHPMTGERMNFTNPAPF